MRRLGYSDSKGGTNGIDISGVLPDNRNTLRATLSARTNYHHAPRRSNRSICQSMNLPLRNTGTLTPIHRKVHSPPQETTLTVIGRRVFADGQWWVDEDDEATTQVKDTPLFYI